MDSSNAEKIDVSSLEKFSPIYLATPYTKVPDGLDLAYWRSCELAAKLIRAGLIVFSPIAHSHPVAIHGGINPLDLGLWMRQCEGLMPAFKLLLVGKLPWWQESVGIMREINWFRGLNRPVLYIDPETLEVSK